jgi:hypothetical protein
MTPSDEIMSLPLDKLVILYRMQAEACTQTSFPLPGYEPVFEAQEKLGLEFKRRGEVAQRRLLDLLDHQDEWVRYFAAADAYTVDPVRCHKALVTLIEEMAMSSDWAHATLLDVDPTFSEQFRAICQAHKASPPKMSAATERYLDNLKDTLARLQASNWKPPPASN